jgi:hypothetical protein
VTASRIAATSGVLVAFAPKKVIFIKIINDLMGFEFVFHIGEDSIGFNFCQVNLIK